MKKTLYLIFIPILSIVLYYVFGTNNENYEETIAQERKARIHFLLNSASSPVTDKNNFDHPGFFEVTKEFRINGKVKHNPKTQQFAIEMSDGNLETYLHYGDIEFTWQGQDLSLVLYQHLERTSEFLLPFGDASNGKTSYGSGRHLPIKFNGGDHIILDFNLAENPYCAYNHSYICPLPPKENVLPIAIEAGEKGPKN